MFFSLKLPIQITIKYTNDEYLISLIFAGIYYDILYIEFNFSVLTHILGLILHWHTILSHNCFISFRYVWSRNGEIWMVGICYNINI